MFSDPSFDLTIFMFRHGADVFFGSLFAIFVFYALKKLKLSKQKPEDNNKKSSNDELLLRISEIEKSTKASKVITQPQVAVKAKKVRVKPKKTSTTKQASVAKMTDTVVVKFAEIVDYSSYDTPAFLRKAAEK